MISLIIAGVLTVLLSIINLRLGKRRLTPDGKLAVFFISALGILIIVFSRFSELIVAIVGFLIVIFVVYFSLTLKQRWFVFDSYLEKGGRPNHKIIRIHGRKVGEVFPDLFNWLTGDGIVPVHVGMDKKQGPFYIGRKPYTGNMLHRIVLFLIVGAISAGGFYSLFFNLNLKEYSAVAGLAGGLMFGVAAALLLNIVGNMLDWAVQVEFDGGDAGDDGVILCKIYGDSNHFRYNMGGVTVTGLFLNSYVRSWLNNFLRYLTAHYPATVREGLQRIDNIERPQIDFMSIIFSDDSNIPKKNITQDSESE